MKKEKDLLNINIKILEQPEPLRLTIDFEDEEIYRKAGNQINEVIRKYRKEHPNLNSGNIMALGLMSFAIRELQRKDKQEKV